MRMRFGIALLVCLVARPSIAASIHDAYFTSNGVRIHYQVAGEGEPVILIHGFAANITAQWGLPGIQRSLAQYYQVIALDARGHGLSAKPHDPKKYGQEMVEDVVRLLDHLGIQRAHVVGYSMGSMIASKLLLTHPDRVLSVILGGGVGIHRGTDTHLLEQIADELDQGKGISTLIRYLTPASRPQPTEAQLRTINQVMSAFNDPKALAAVVRSWPDLTLNDDRLQSNKVPVLELIGQLDPLRKNVDELAHEFRGLQVKIIARADHMNAFETPQFLADVKAFLAEHREAAAKSETEAATR